MTSRLTQRFEQLRKNLGMIPMEVEQAKQRTEATAGQVERAERLAGRALELVTQGVTGYRVVPRTGEIVYRDGRREQVLK